MMIKPRIEVITAPNEKLSQSSRQFCASWMCPREASRSADWKRDVQYRQSREEVMMSLGNVLEEERSIRRHRSSDPQSESKQSRAEPEKCRGEGGEKTEYCGEKKGEIECWRSSFRVRV